MIEPREAVKRMNPYLPPLEGRRGKLRLDFNENTAGCSPAVLNAFKNLNSEDIAVYPEYERLMEELSNLLNMPAENILATNATDEAIMVINQTFIDRDQEVILPVPTYAMFKIYSQIAGGSIIEVLYNEDLSFPYEKVIRRISHDTRMVVIVSPNNPTGTDISENHLAGILKKAENTIVVLDEAYAHFKKSSYMNLVHKWENLIVIQTFSKAFGMAGLRLGYIVADRNLIDHMRKVRSPYSISSTTVIAALEAVKDREFIEKTSEEIMLCGLELIEFLKAKGILVYPSSANFVLARFGEDAERIETELRKNQILVRNRSNDPMLQGCLRITFGTREQTRRLMDCLENIL
ncbi:MAG: histidinol-phosphate transaminase [bacterium]